MCETAPDEIRSKVFQGNQKDTTNNRMELMAVIAGLGAITEPCHVTVFSDSKYVVDGITKWIDGWKGKGWRTSKGKPVENKDLWVCLEAVTVEHDITWEWIRGHDDNEWNDFVDMIADSERKKISES